MKRGSGMVRLEAKGRGRKRAALCGGPLVQRLAVGLAGLLAVQVVNGALCMRGCGDDEALVVLQRLEP